jgi:hypothetical protein
MTDTEFWDKVRNRAYYKHLNKIRSNMYDNPVQDWEESVREQAIDERIREEAYLHSLNNGNDPFQNWVTASREIMERIQFLAFTLHEIDINKSPSENWINAQNLYLDKF